jgi:hypothetical protein
MVYFASGNISTTACAITWAAEWRIRYSSLSSFIGSCSFSGGSMVLVCGTSCRINSREKNLSPRLGREITPTVPPRFRPQFPKGYWQPLFNLITGSTVSPTETQPVQGHAHGWFSPASASEETLSLRSLLPVEPITGYSSRSSRFICRCGRNRARTYDLCDVNAVL